MDGCILFLLCVLIKLYGISVLYKISDRLIVLIEYGGMVVLLCGCLWYIMVDFKGMFW